MSKRNITQEIQAIQARLQKNKSNRLYEIENTLNWLIENKSNDELFKYIPIATVACMQGFFRYKVKEIIDSSKPVSKNIVNFKNKVKPPDFDVLAEIQSETFTLGELFAHSLSYSSLESIISNMSDLIGEEFDKKLKTIELNNSMLIWLTYAPINVPSFKDKYGDIKKGIELTFKMRNSFCHELATNIKLEKRKIIIGFYYSKLFIEHSEALINKLLYPNRPTSEKEWAKYHLDQNAQKENELNQLIDSIKAVDIDGYYYNSKSDFNYFDEAHEKWKEYRNAFAKAEAHLFNTPWHSKIISSSMAESTNERIQRIQSSYFRPPNKSDEYIFE